MKKALVVGAGGFIGHNLIKRLKSEGWYVHGVSRKHPAYEPTQADKYTLVDAQKDQYVDQFYDRVYQLAADMGGAGFTFTGDNDANILTCSTELNLNLLKQLKEVGCGTVLYSSSVCCYADDSLCRESDAYPANPSSEYGWEKILSERLYQAYAKNYGLNVKIARFHNTFGPNGTYKGGREKSPAALSRKIAESSGEIEIWGDGEQIRPFIYIEDLLDGTEILMNSEFAGPVNIGPSEGVSINQMADILIKASGKNITKKYIPGPIGMKVRQTSNELAKEKLGWEPKYSLEESLKKTYEWIAGQINKDKLNHA